MDTPQQQYRPRFWEVVRIFAVLGVIVLINVITHNDVFTAFAALFIFGGVIAWHFVRTWRGLI